MRIRLSSQSPRSSSRRPSPHHALLAAAVATALVASLPAQQQFAGLPRVGLPADSDFTRAVALGDVDGDGDLDVVVGNGGYGVEQNRIYLSDGSGVFTDATASNMPAVMDVTRSVALGDVDGDGDLDLVVGNSGQTRLYRNNGAGVFTDVTGTHMPVDSDPTESVVLGDVDGDGDLDLVVGNGAYSSGWQNRLYVNNGQGAFTDVTAVKLPVRYDYTRSVVLGDVDGDGDLDLVVGNGYALFYGGPPSLGEQNRLLLNDGSGNFTDATATNLPTDSEYTRSVALGDVDGDGDLDLVCGNEGQNRLYLNDGYGTFTEATATQMPVAGDRTTSVTLGDVDGDGDLDLVAGSSTASPFAILSLSRLYLNDAAGSFGDATTSRMPATPSLTWAVALGDVDGDGDLDLVSGDVGQNGLDLNLQRQLHAPAAPQIGQAYGLDAYLRYGPPSTVDLAAIYLSTAPASIPLGALGTIGIDPPMAAPFPTLIIPQPAGVASVGFTVPNVPSLVGQAIYSQAMLVAYPNDLRLSNVVRDVIQ